MTSRHSNRTWTFLLHEFFSLPSSLHEFFFLAISLARIFFLGNFPCMNFFSFFFPTPPPHHFSNGPSLIDSWSGWNFLTRTATASGIRRIQGIKRPGNETGSSLLVQSVMQRMTDTSPPSALPVRSVGVFTWRH